MSRCQNARRWARESIQSFLADPSPDRIGGLAYQLDSVIDDISDTGDNIGAELRRLWMAIEEIDGWLHSEESAGSDWPWTSHLRDILDRLLGLL